jgi:hypothetical protein
LKGGHRPSLSSFCGIIGPTDSRQENDVRLPRRFVGLAIDDKQAQAVEIHSRLR